MDSIFILLLLVLLLFSAPTTKTNAVTTTQPSSSHQQIPYSPMHLHFFFNKTTKNEECNDETVMTEKSLQILQNVINLFDLPHYRLENTEHYNKKTTTTESPKEHQQLFGSSTLHTHRPGSNSNHNNNSKDDFCYTEFRCLQDIPWFTWWGVDYDCFQIVGLIIAMPLDMKRTMLQIEDFDVDFNNALIPEDKLNATKSLDTLPPSETKFSEPVQFDPTSFWVCMLQDPVIGGASVPHQKFVTNSTRDGGEYDKYYYNEKDRRVEKRPAKYVSQHQQEKAFYVGNVTTALRMHLNADPDLVSLDPVPLPEFVLKDKNIPASPNPAEAPRFIAFKVMPNQTDFNSSTSSSSGGDDGSGSSSSGSDGGFLEETNNQEIILHKPAKQNRNIHLRSFGGRVHKRIVRPPKNSTHPHFFPKQKASPNDAAATAVALMRTDREDTVFSTGYSCYPYNSSLSAENASMTNFTATNASVDFIPLYTFPVFITIENNQTISDLLDLDENENGNSFLESKLTWWWDSVIEEGGADLRVVPLYVTQASDFYVLPWNSSSSSNSSTTTTSSSPSFKQKVLFLVTVGPIETRVNISTNEKFSGDFIDTIGSCIFTWMNPEPPSSDLVKDLTLAFLGLFSVSMLGIVIIVVIWGSMEPKDGGSGHHGHHHGGESHHTTKQQHHHAKVSSSHQHNKKNKNEDDDSSHFDISEHEQEKQRKKAAGEYYLSESLLR